MKLASASLDKEFESDAVEDLYSEFSNQKESIVEHNQILDLDYEPSLIAPDAEVEYVQVQQRGLADIIERIELLYPQNSGFFNFFQELGGIKTFIQVAETSLDLWKNKEASESWKQWLRELDSFSKVPSYFQ